MVTFYKPNPNGGSWGKLIETIEAVRDTPAFIVILERGKERRISKVGSYDRYFPTELEARQYLKDLYENKIKQAEKVIQENTKLLKELEKFKL